MGLNYYLGNNSVPSVAPHRNMTTQHLQIDKEKLLNLDNIFDITKVGNAIKAQFRVPASTPQDIAVRHVLDTKTAVYQISFPDKDVLKFSDISVMGTNYELSVIHQIYLLTEMDGQHKEELPHIIENSLADQLQEEIENMMCSDKYASLSVEDIIKVSSAAIVKAINKKLKKH